MLSLTSDSNLDRTMIHVDNDDNVDDVISAVRTSDIPIMFIYICNFLSDIANSSFKFHSLKKSVI